MTDENTSESDASFIAQALPAFISEAQEQIEALEQLLLQLESAPGDRELLDALFRCMHTVKGSAGIFGLDDVVTFTHHAETLLDRLREGHVMLTPELSTLLLQANDHIRALVAAAQGITPADEGADRNREELVQRLREASGESASAATDTSAASAVAGEAATSISSWNIAARFGADSFRNGMDPLAIINYVRGLGEVSSMACDMACIPALGSLDAENCHLAVSFVLSTALGREAIVSAFSFAQDDCELDIQEAAAVATVQAPPAALAAPAAPRLQADSAQARSPDDNRFIRVQADRLDDVINLLGELVIAGAGASLLARQSRQGALIEANQQVTRLIEDIRNSTLQLRMVPIGETFSRFRRVVRDTAAELGKDVVLEVIGGETELDKSVVERIADPLMHLVRNALDHGLESPADRVASGKPPQGVLTLAACHESGSIVIRISDDGRGIQRDKVLQRAIERGLVESGAVPPDDTILNLVFEAGFSTAEKVTNLSGRGVGMDVVRRNIEALRGSVALSSLPGQGSSIEIRLPLTLAIIDGFLVGVGPSRFIFPLESVVEVIERGEGAVVPDGSGRCCVELRGKVLPVVDLRSLYGFESRPPQRSSIVVVRAGASRYGVMVDALLGQHQTVIKPLGRLLGSLRGMSGSSILGTGEVALIFDVASLGHLAAAQPPSSIPAYRLQPERQTS